MKKIDVTKTFLPEKRAFLSYIDRIWDSKQLTNGGVLVNELERKINLKLGLSCLQLVANGTLALQISLEALGVGSGEIITTPFSYVATTSAILWQKCKPVFADIDRDTLCIDPLKIESLITENTRAIMPVHVYGNVCDVEKIDKIAKKYNLPVIYDAAHAFGVQYKGRSAAELGDASIFSFHATKLFHTCEGGAIALKSDELADKVRQIKSFGHVWDDHHRLGINAKMSELHAAMGLCNLNYVDEIIEKRKLVVNQYDLLLGDKVKRIKWNSLATKNYGYYPVIFKSEAQLIQVAEFLKRHNVNIRRYFYPSLNKLPYLKQKYNCPVSEDVSSRIACLPLSTYITKADALFIVELIEKALSHKVSVASI